MHLLGYWPLPDPNPNPNPNPNPHPNPSPNPSPSPSPNPKQEQGVRKVTLATANASLREGGLCKKCAAVLFARLGLVVGVGVGVANPNANP